MTMNRRDPGTDLISFIIWCLILEAVLTWRWPWQRRTRTTRNDTDQ